jgi:hypothetical protein
MDWQELENRVQKIIILSDKLDILAFELRQTTLFLKDATQKVRPERQV